MGRKKQKSTEESIIKSIISSKETAEVFIKAWMERHNASREAALAKLKELGIEYTELRDEH